MTSVQDQLLTIERQLWTNNATLYHDHLVPEALLAFAETGLITRDAAVDAIKQESASGKRWAEANFSDVRLLSIGAHAALLTYRVAARWAHETATYRALASSLYVRRDGAWKLAFHQQTALT